MDDVDNDGNSALILSIMSEKLLFKEELMSI